MRAVKAADSTSDTFELLGIVMICFLPCGTWSTKIASAQQLRWNPHGDEKDTCQRLEKKWAGSGLTESLRRRVVC